MSSSKNIFLPSQGQLFDQQNGNMTSAMNPKSVSSTTTRLVAPRPFYRSQITPEPFDYTNNTRREADQLQYIQNFPQRRLSVNQINGANPYLSDQESSSSTKISMHPQFHQQYRSTNPNIRPVISVSAKQSPLITIASAGSPNRSEIRVSSSPQTNKSTFREIRISRPESPVISFNRTSSNQSITNGNTGAFHISVGTPTTNLIRGRTSPSIHLDSLDTRYTSNIVSNRFKPLITYTSPNSNAFERTPTIVTLPPAPNLTVRHGNLLRKNSNDIDDLTKLLMKTMHSTNAPNVFGMCARCNDEIVGEENGLVAMDRMYHVSCFTCTMCGCRLRGMHFYSMENKPYCESCYINSLEKCVVCSQPITNRILRATGKPYHAQCFTCIACQKNLDGYPFTVDATMQIHCIECFHQKFAPRCYACHRPILPNNTDEETIRIVAHDRSYHVDCYRCENCQTQFTNEEGCYPIDNRILCIQCNRIYSKTMLNVHS